MAVVGLGTDIVEIARIAQVIARSGEALAKRVLTATEFAQYQQQKQPASFLAKRFAVKEAAAKALGTGIAKGVSFHDFIVSHHDTGQPKLDIYGKAAELCQARGITSVLVSIADEKHYAVATVLLQSNTAN